MSVSEEQSRGDRILMLYAPDGKDWAKFIANRLLSPDYNIVSDFYDITSPPPALSVSPPNQPPSQVGLEESVYECAFVDDNQNGGDCSNSNHKRCDNDNEEEDGQSIYENTPRFVDTLKDGASGKDGSQCPYTATTNALHKRVQESRACAIFISPNVIENEEPFVLDPKILKPDKTAILYLGVELGEVMDYFGDQYQDITRCQCSFIDGTEETINNGVVSLITAYESEEDEVEYVMEDIYQIPNDPVQKNSVEKIFPRTLTETERDVYVLLNRISEEQVFVVVEDKSLKLPLTQVCDRLYTVALPANIYGEVNVALECQGRVFAEESVHAYSKLDLIQSILDSEINPHALIASSLGLNKEDTGSLDTALAFKLQELASVMTFKALCPCEEALKVYSSDEISTKKWPTLLHFAAQYNLRLFCTELLAFPGMFAAACTQNRDGEFPSQIASRKGFRQLENDLIEFMKQVRREVDPDYISSSQVSLSSAGSSMTNLSDNGNGLLLSVFSDQADSDSMVYWDMQDIRRPSAPQLVVTDHHETKESQVRPPIRSNSDFCRKKLGSSRFRPLPKRPDSPSDGEDEEKKRLQYREDSPTSVKALKMLGATREEVSTRFSTLEPSPRGRPAHSQMHEYDQDRVSVTSDKENKLRGLASAIDSKKVQVKERVKMFFNKVKGPKKSTSDSSPKSSGHRARSESEPASTKFHYQKKNKINTQEERDSGSYSDEEKKPKAFVQRKKAMVRRCSKRLESAKKESFGVDAPQLPERKTSTFRSFIK